VSSISPLVKASILRSPHGRQPNYEKGNATVTGSEPPFEIWQIRTIAAQTCCNQRVNCKLQSKFSLDGRSVSVTPQTHRTKVRYTALKSAGKFVFDYVTRRFNASLAGLKLVGLDVR